MKEELIAPCGMNCAICSGYLRNKKPCLGCKVPDKNKPSGCKVCMVTECEKRKASKSGFCYECKSYPCLRIKQLDKRYITKYHMSMIENLTIIKDQGMTILLIMEELSSSSRFEYSVLSAYVQLVDVLTIFSPFLVIP